MIKYFTLLYIVIALLAVISPIFAYQAFTKTGQSEKNLQICVNQLQYCSAHKSALACVLPNNIKFNDNSESECHDIVYPPVSSVINDAVTNLFLFPVEVGMILLGSGFILSYLIIGIVYGFLLSRYQKRESTFTTIYSIPLTLVLVQVLFQNYNLVDNILSFTRGDTITISITALNELLTRFGINALITVISVWLGMNLVKNPTVTKAHIRSKTNLSRRKKR